MKVVPSAFYSFSRNPTTFSSASSNDEQIPFIFLKTIGMPKIEGGKEESFLAT
jgi:hypothetical protein